MYDNNNEPPMTAQDHEDELQENLLRFLEMVKADPQWAKFVNVDELCARINGSNY